MQKLSKSKMAYILYIQCKSHEIGKRSYLVLICQTPRHSWSKNACFLTLVWCQRCRISRHSVRNETLTSNPGYSKIRMSESELQRVRSRKYDEIHDKFHYPRGIGDCRNFQPIRAWISDSKMNHNRNSNFEFRYIMIHFVYFCSFG